MKKTSKIINTNSIARKFVAFFIMCVIVFSSSYSPVLASNVDNDNATVSNSTTSESHSESTSSSSNSESSSHSESSSSSSSTSTNVNTNINNNNTETNYHENDNNNHEHSEGDHDDHDNDEDHEHEHEHTPPTPEPQSLTIVATKIVCNSETDLPNWGLGGPDITSSTATNFISNHSNCHVEPNWKFQWSFDDENGKLIAPILSGDFVGEAVTTLGYTSWNTFGITDTNGVISTTIFDVKGASKIWVREVLKDGYLGFNYPQIGNNDISAEMYCDKDVLNYDNYDYVDTVFGKTYYCIAFNVKKVVTTPPTNQAPVITLVGQNPVTITVGDVYTDAGATATDLEDGNITSQIVLAGTVDASVIGTYTVTYNVKDSAGLSATPVTRTINVVPATPVLRGKITFCLVLANEDNAIATSNTGLPQGTFSISLSTSTLDFATTTIASKSWNTESFAPNKKSILNVNDSDCITYDNLDYGTYNYTTLSVNSSTWNGAVYNDQDTQPVNNVFDFFAYGDTNTNSDGRIILNENRYERTLLLYSKYKNVTIPGGGGSTPAANLLVTKSSDKSTAGVGDTVTYTITVKNEGPSTAKNVKVLDTLPSTLDFISASTSVGSYATSTSLWTIGELLNGSTTVLAIEVKVKTGTEGQKISNTAVVSSDVSDPDTINNTSVVDVNVNVPVPPNTGGGGNGGGGNGGGGGGGNGPIVGSLGVVNNGGGSVSAPVVTSGGGSCYYLYDYLRKDFNNNPIEVRKLQVFLRDLEGFTTIQVTGVYDDQTIVALDAFQARYKDDILTPWGHTAPTSYTYILTKKKVNEIYCRMAFPVTPLQQIEIDNYRAFLQGLKDSGVFIQGGNEVMPEVSTSTPSEVGSSIKDTLLGGLSTLAGLSSTTKGIASDFTANVISSGKKLANLIMSMFVWPFSKINKDSVNQCIASAWSNWLNIILILVIIVISYLWYREYKNNKRIEDINKEIDLK